VQRFLQGEGVFTGNATGYFGPLTQEAVQKWQAAHGIVSSGTPDTTGYGAVGPSTRSAFYARCHTTPTPSATAPTIITINPNTGTANEAIEIYGNNLSAVSEVRFYSSNGLLAATFVSPTIQSTSAQKIFLNIGGPFAYNADPGIYQVRVVSPAGTSNAVSFTLTAPSATAPHITSVSPSSGSTNTAVTVYGTNLSGASGVEFYHPDGQLGATILLSSVTSTSVSFTVSGGVVGVAGADAYQIRIVTPAGRSNALMFNLVSSTPAPTCTMTATPSSVVLGQPVTVTWTSQNATKASGFIGIDYDAQVSGSVPIIYGQVGTANYHIDFTGPGGSVTCSTSFTVLASTSLPATPTVSITALASTIQSGQSATLSWSSTNATRCALTYGSSQDTVGTSGSRIISPSEKTTYLLWCTNDPGTGKDGPSAQASVTVMVNPASTPAPTCTISNQYGTGAMGLPGYILTWTTWNATSASLSGGQLVTGVPVTGNMYSQPTNLTVFSQNTYTLTVSGPSGTGSCFTKIAG
jgi:peptidoglycan hydrolase-like protein with peptidoglycan-binding domain